MEGFIDPSSSLLLVRTDQRINVHVDVRRPEQNLQKSSSYGSFRGPILIKYMLETSNSYVIQPYDRADPCRLVDHDQPYFKGSFLECITNKTFMSPDAGPRKFIADHLSRLLSGLCTMDTEPIVERIVEVGREGCADVTNAGKGTLKINVSLRLDYVHIHDERHWIEMETTNAEDYRMIPASKRAIEKLEIKKATASDSCVICMEDVFSGTEAACMPCSHAFHEECIVNWLKSSHSCPICRFEVPIENQDNDRQLVIAD